MTPPTLRDLLARPGGYQHLQSLIAAADLQELAYRADLIERDGTPISQHLRHTLTVVDGDENDPGEQRHARWILELYDDPHTRRSLLANLDAVTRADLDISTDMQQRPFTLENADGPYRCANCGTLACGRHTRIVDRCELLGDAVTSDDLRYCPACITTSEPPD